MNLRIMTASLVCVAICGTGLMADDTRSLQGVKCIVKPGAAAKRETSLEYNGGRVYFCCEGCRKEFEKDNTKFSARANLQLVQTKQAKQTRCPMSGQACKSENHTGVQGTEVEFCCEGCKSIFEDATAEEQIELAFASDIFEKSFKMVVNKATDDTTFVQQSVSESTEKAQPQVGGQSTSTRSSVRYRSGLRFRRR